MVRSLRNAVREAALIAAAAVLLATSYNALTGKGIFSDAKHEPSAPPVAQEVPPTFILFEEALGFFNSGEGLFVDARHEYDYKLGHIKGAVNLPLKEFDTHTAVYAGWPKDKLLVVYCDGAECNSSVELAKKLSAAGFTNVKIFFGGWTEWQTNQKSTEQ
jgi:rhodanese-related sulfurtransferase